MGVGFLAGRLDQHGGGGVGLIVCRDFEDITMSLKMWLTEADRFDSSKMCQTVLKSLA